MEDEINDINEKLSQMSSVMEENNRMIRSLYKRARWASFLVAVKWILIIGFTVGSFYFIQPMLENTLNLYNSFGHGGTKSATSTNSSITDLLKSL